jgi:hypothetical protein
MKNKTSNSDEVEVTAWILFVALLALIIAFNYLFWKRASPAPSGMLDPGAAPRVAVCSDPRVPVWPPWPGLLRPPRPGPERRPG